MKEFKDEEGRPWRVALTCASAARIKDLVTIEIVDESKQPDGTTKRDAREVPFDIIDAASITQTLEVLRQKYGKVAEALYAVVLKQVEERKLTKEEFFDGLRGDAIEGGAKALEQELIDFFPQRRRKVIGLIAQKTDEVEAEMVANAVAQMEATTVQTLLERSGMTSGKPLAFSESTPESGPIANSVPQGMPA